MKIPARTFFGAGLLLAGVALWPACAADRSELTAEQFQQMLRRFPDADLNKDGKLTLKEYREFRRQTQAGRQAAVPRPLPVTSNAPSAIAADIPHAGPMDIRVTSDKPVPVNPRVYGIICAEMLRKNLVDSPEYLAALTELKFRTFLYPGGSLSYYHHPTGTGGSNIRPEEFSKSRMEAQGLLKEYASGPDHFEQYVQFVKASGGEALFVANVLNGNAAELDEFLSRLRVAGIPIAGVALGQEMHLGPGRALGLDGYIERIKPLIAMLRAKYPAVPVVAPGTPVGRVGDRASDSFHDWNQALAKLPGITGFSQYGWTEFGGQQRLGAGRGAAGDDTPASIWRKYDEFVSSFPARQISVYQSDWGADKKMFMTQWGTHADRNTPLQGLHLANFYFFLAQYNAAHEDYFAVATSSVNLALEASRNAHQGGTVYREKIVLLIPYLYSKPFRHLFSGDKRLLTASVKGPKGDGQGQTVKALAAASPDGRKFLYLLNTGPSVALGRVTFDAEALSDGLVVQIESAFGDPASPPGAATARRAASASANTFTGEKVLRDLVLEPSSLTLLILPSRARAKLEQSTH